MSLAARLREAREKADLSQAALAGLLNAGQTTVATWEKGKNEPDLATIERIAKRVGVTPEWLAFGGRDGPESNFVRVVELDPHAMAGDGGSLEVWEGARESEAFVGYHGYPATGFREAYGAAPERVRIVQVIGDSMEPTLRPGQRVMVDISDRKPTPPGLFVLWDGLGIVIKRVQYIAHSDPPTVKISSDNPRYDPLQRLLDEAYLQGRVIGSWERR